MAAELTREKKGRCHLRPNGLTARPVPQSGRQVLDIVCAECRVSIENLSAATRDPLGFG